MHANDKHGKIRNKYQLKLILNGHKYHRHLAADVHLIFRLEINQCGFLILELLLLVLLKSIVHYCLKVWGH